jgi:hypothetical protein
LEGQRLQRIRNSVAVRSGFGIVSRYDGESTEPAMVSR